MRSVFIGSLLLAANIALANGIAVLCYHDIAPHPANDMQTTPQNFADHVKWLHEQGFVTLSLEELAAILSRRKPPPAKAVVITFDDGYEGVYRFAFPLLEKYHDKAAIFLVTSAMGTQHGIMQHLTWPQIDSMKSVIEPEVHAHALHVELDEFAKKKGNIELIKQDWSSAEALIKSKTKLTPHYLAWPYGHYTKALLDIAHQHGFRGLITTDCGVNRVGGDLLKIKRIRLSSRYDTLARLRSKLKAYGVS